MSEKQEEQMATPIVKRLTVILKDGLEFGRALNAVGHLSVAMANQIGSKEFEPVHYKDATGTLYPFISKHPVIILKAKSSTQLDTLYSQLQENSIPCTAFLGTMVGGTSDEQVLWTSEKKRGDVEFLAVATFGAREELAPFTKKFSLFK